MILYRTPSFEFAEDRHCDTGASRAYIVSLIEGEAVLTLDSTFPGGASSCDAIDTYDDAGIAIAAAERFFEIAELNNQFDLALAA